MKIGDTRYGQDDEGNVFEYVATRMLSKTEVSDLKAKQRQERKAEMGGIIGALLGALTGSNGEPECIVCGGHHEGAFTHLEVEFQTHLPAASTVTKTYLSRDAADIAMGDHLKSMIEGVGQNVNEIDGDGADFDEEHPTFIRQYATGRGRNKSIVGMQTIRLLSGDVPENAITDPHAH